MNGNDIRYIDLTAAQQLAELIHECDAHFRNGIHTQSFPSHVITRLRLFHDIPHKT
jgi:hypothetical protein